VHGSAIKSTARIAYMAMIHAVSEGCWTMTQGYFGPFSFGYERQSETGIAICIFGMGTTVWVIIT